jgi:hypothetical protein
MLLGFINGHDLYLGTFRAYGVSTDIMPHKETAFFIALALLGTGASWYMAMLLVRLSGAWIARTARALVKRPRTVVAALAMFSVIATALVSWLSLQHTTVVLDEDLYRFQVDLLRDGVFYTDTPIPLEPFREFYSVQVRNVWTGIYAWGHIAALVPGYVIGFPQLLGHICAPIAVVLTYLLGRELFPDDEASPLIAAAVTALSPFLAFTCATTHNSITSLVFTNVGLLGLIRGVRRGSAPFAFLAGLVLGAAIHSRPLSAIAIAAPVGFMALVVGVRMKRPVIRLIVAFILGLLPGILMYFWINWHITGDPMMTTVTMSHPATLRIFGFENTPIPHTPLLAFGKSGTNLIRMLLWTTGSLFGAFTLMGLVGGLRRRTLDLLLLVPVFTCFFCYYFYFTSPVSDTGPLYYLDLVPLLALISGRTITAFVERLPPATDPTTPDRRLAIVGAGFVASYLVALATFWPMQGIAGRSVTNNNLLPYRAVEKAGIHNAIVFFNRNPNNKSWKLTPIPPKPDLSDDVIYARYEVIYSPVLYNRYHDTRSFFMLHFDEENVTIEPWYPPETP